MCPTSPSLTPVREAVSETSVTLRESRVSTRTRAVTRRTSVVLVAVATSRPTARLVDLMDSTVLMARTSLLLASLVAVILDSTAMLPAFTDLTKRTPTTTTDPTRATVPSTRSTTALTATRLDTTSLVDHSVSTHTDAPMILITTTPITKPTRSTATDTMVTRATTHTRPTLVMDTEPTTERYDSVVMIYKIVKYRANQP